MHEQTHAYVALLLLQLCSTDSKNGCVNVLISRESAVQSVFLQVWFDPQDCKSLISMKAEAGFVYFVRISCTAPLCCTEERPIFSVIIIFFF